MTKQCQMQQVDRFERVGRAATPARAPPPIPAPHGDSGNKWKLVRFLSACRQRVDSAVWYRSISRNLCIVRYLQTVALSATGCRGIEMPHNVFVTKQSNTYTNKQTSKF